MVWDRFGDVPNYVEPFFGSGAVLLVRPSAPLIETVNDADSFISNFWRAVQSDPKTVARWADWPINETDLHARHLWLVNEGRAHVERLTVDPDYFDAKVAGWWVWGICQWIGSGWCSGQGPWKRPHLGDAGQGINRQRPHLGNAGQGINRQLPHLGNAGRGQCAEWTEHLTMMMQTLSDRLRRVRVCCGDWSRICGPTPTTKLRLTGVFLDPPYSFNERQVGLYTVDTDVAADVRRWAIENGNDPLLRIALCGYSGEHEMPADWEVYHWKAKGGYGSQGEGRGIANAERETVWFSPHCRKPEQLQPALFDWAVAP